MDAEKTVGRQTNAPLGSTFIALRLKKGHPTVDGERFERGARLCTAPHMNYGLPGQPRPDVVIGLFNACD
jgi:hypothetical protein